MASEDKKLPHQVAIARVIEELVGLSKHLDSVVAESAEIRERLRVIREALGRPAPGPAHGLADRPPVEPGRVFQGPEAKAPDGDHQAPAAQAAAGPGPDGEALRKHIADTRADFENKTYQVPPQAPSEEFARRDAGRCEAVSKTGSRCTRPKGHPPPHQHDARMAVQSWGEA